MPDATDRRIVEVRHFEHPSGVDQCDIRYADGTVQTHTHLAWTEARALAERPGLEHRDDERGAITPPAPTYPVVQQPPIPQQPPNPRRWPAMVGGLALVAGILRATSSGTATGARQSHVRRPAGADALRLQHQWMRCRVFPLARHRHRPLLPRRTGAGEGLGVRCVPAFRVDQRCGLDVLRARLRSDLPQPEPAVWHPGLLPVLPCAIVRPHPHGLRWRNPCRTCHRWWRHTADPLLVHREPVQVPVGEGSA